MSTTWKEYNKIFKTSYSELVRSAVEAIGKISLLLGPSAVYEKMNDIIGWLVTLLKKKAPCQVKRESFDEETSEEDYIMLQSVLDTLQELTKSLGSLIVPHLAGIFNTFSPYVMIPTSESCDYILSTIAEIATEIEDDIAPFAGPFLDISTKAMIPDEDDAVILNACRCAREMIYFAPDVCKPKASSLLSSIKMLFTGNYSNRPLASGAVAGLIAQVSISYPDLLPLDQVLESFL